MKLEKFQALPKWLRSNAFFRAKLSNDSNGPGFSNKAHVEVHPLDANLIASQKANGKHTLFLDLDDEHFVSPSSTPGHSHLYINTDLDLEALKEIIDVLAKHGIVQQGIKNQLDSYGFLTLRPPGVQKGDEYDDASVNEAKILEQESEDFKNSQDKLGKYTFDGAIKPVEVKQLSGKFQALKQQLKAGLKTSSKDIQDAFNYKSMYTIAVTGEIFDQVLKHLAAYLSLNHYNFIVNKPKSETYIKYQGRNFCEHRHDIWEDVHVLTFYKKDFQGQYPGLVWDQVLNAIKISLEAMT
jgi:hypothetical protein